MKIKPLFKNVMVEIVKGTSEKTTNGIYLAKPEDGMVETATVIGVGSGVYEVSEGDVVLFKAFSVDSVEIDGAKVSFIKEDDILAIK